MTKKLVVVVDTQNDFMLSTGLLSVAGAESIITPLQKYLYNLKPEEIEAILFTFDTHDAEIYAASEEAKQFPLHCEWGTAGWENVVNLDRVEDTGVPVWWLRKGVFDMWIEDDIEVLQNANSVSREEFVARMKERGVTEVIMVGVASDFCVRYALNGFLKAGFDVTVKADLTKGIVQSINQMAADEDDYKYNTHLHVA